MDFINEGKTGKVKLQDIFDNIYEDCDSALADYFYKGLKSKMDSEDNIDLADAEVQLYIRDYLESHENDYQYDLLKQALEPYYDHTYDLADEDVQESYEVLEEDEYLNENATFEEIIYRMECAEIYEDLYNAAMLIVDPKLQNEVTKLIQQCEDDGDEVEEAYSIVTSDLLDMHINDKNEEFLNEAKTDNQYYIRIKACLEELEVSSFEELQVELDRLIEEEVIDDDEYDEFCDILSSEENACEDYINRRSKVTNTDWKDELGLEEDYVKGAIDKMIATLHLNENKKIKTEEYEPNIGSSSYDLGIDFNSYLEENDNVCSLLDYVKFTLATLEADLGPSGLDSFEEVPDFDEILDDIKQDIGQGDITIDDWNKEEAEDYYNDWLDDLNLEESKKIKTEVKDKESLEDIAKECIECDIDYIKEVIEEEGSKKSFIERAMEDPCDFGWDSIIPDEYYEDKRLYALIYDLIVKKENKEESEENPQEFDYRLLSRLKSDCDYYLGNGNRNAEHCLWAKNEQGQIDKMREIYNKLKEKPEWLSEEDINNYAKEMGVVDLPSTIDGTAEKEIQDMVDRAEKRSRENLIEDKKLSMTDIEKKYNKPKNPLQDAPFEYFADWNEAYKEDRDIQYSEATPYILDNVKKWIAIRDEYKYVSDYEQGNWYKLQVRKTGTKYCNQWIFIEPDKELWRMNKTANEFYNVWKTPNFEMDFDVDDLTSGYLGEKRSKENLDEDKQEDFASLRKLEREELDEYLQWMLDNYTSICKSQGEDNLEACDKHWDMNDYDFKKTVEFLEECEYLDGEQMIEILKDWVNEDHLSMRQCALKLMSADKANEYKRKQAEIKNESRDSFNREELVAVKNSIDTALDDLQITSNGTTGAMEDKVLINDLRNVSQSVGSYLNRVGESKKIKKEANGIAPDFKIDFEGDMTIDMGYTNEEGAEKRAKELLGDVAKSTNVRDLNVDVKDVKRIERENKTLTESEEKFSGVEFEKNIPHVMRYKQYDVIEEEDGKTLYWITQQFFTLEELKKFQEAFTKLTTDTLNFKDAYVTVRDLSTYDFEEDHEDGVLCYVTKNSLDYEGYEEYCKENNFDLNKGWLEENKELKKEDKTIWSSEYNGDETTADEAYQEYLDEFEPTPIQPKSFEDWLEDTFEDWLEAESNAYTEEHPEVKTMKDWEIDEIDFELREKVQKEIEANMDDLKEQYEEYVNDIKESGIMTKPANKETWQSGWYEQDAEAQWEVMDEDFSFNVWPMIQSQCKDDILIMLGSVGRWNGTFNGGKIIHADEKNIRNIMGDYDEVSVTADDEGHISMGFDHHDGTDGMFLYTIPEDLTELAKAMGYEDADELDMDIRQDYVDMEELAKHVDLLVSIINKGRGNV